MNCYRFRVDMAKSSQHVYQYLQSRLRSMFWKWAGRSLYHLNTPSQIRSQVLMYIAVGARNYVFFILIDFFPPVQNILEISFLRTNNCPSNTLCIWYRERKDRCMFWFLVKTSLGCKWFLKTGGSFLRKNKNMHLFLLSLYYKHIIFDGSWSIFCLFITTGWTTLS